MPGGRIDVTFLPDGAQQVAGDAGDYEYPDDVRLDSAGELLYVKASGSRAVGVEMQTWLFEYNLRERRQLGQARVDPDVLPKECPETP
jgi:hypothetical protein